MKKGWLFLAVLALLSNALAVSAVAPLATPPSDRTVTLTAKSINAIELSKRVSGQVQFRFVFLHKENPQQPFAADFRHLPVQELAQALSHQGAVAFSYDLPGNAASPDNLLEAQVSLAAQDVAGQLLADLLAQISNHRVIFRPRSADARLAFDIKRVPFGELPSVLAQFGDVRIASPH